MQAIDQMKPAISRAGGGTMPGSPRLKWTAFNQHGDPVYTFTPIGIVPRRPA